MTGNSLLLDTSVVIRHFRAAAYTDRFAQYEQLYLPQQALGELYFGAYRSQYPEKHLSQIDRFLQAAEVLSPDHDTSRHYGEIAAHLARSGTPIPQNDIWIASLAVQWGLLLATNDHHFSHIEGLRFIDGKALE